MDVTIMREMKRLERRLLFLRDGPGRSPGRRRYCAASEPYLVILFRCYSDPHYVSVCLLLSRSVAGFAACERLCAVLISAT